MGATVTLTRHLIGVQIRGPFDVLIDGMGVARIDAHKTIQTSVEPGHHTLQLRRGRYSSRTAAFDATESQVVAFRCGEKRFLPIFLASFVVPSLAIPPQARLVSDPGLSEPGPAVSAADPDPLRSQAAFDQIHSPACAH